MSTLRVDNLTTLSGNGIAADIASVSGAQLSNRNKVHNGDMRISQRYGTNAHTPSTTTRNYVIDRWAYWSNQASKASVQQVTDAPAGFYNSAKCTSLSAHTADSGHWFGYLTTIEAQDIYDLAQGTANAKNITLSFYVKSSITGTWAAAVRTKPGSPSRSYPFNYTINSANTWERKTITIPGDTTGTWNKGNSVGAKIIFSLGIGASFQTANVSTWETRETMGTDDGQNLMASTSNNLYLTGVQLEVGDTATSFEHRSVGDELIRCQRYFVKGRTRICFNGVTGRYGFRTLGQFNMRAAPTVTGSFATQGLGSVQGYGSDSTSTDVRQIYVQTTAGSGLDGTITYEATSEF